MTTFHTRFQIRRLVHVCQLILFLLRTRDIKYDSIFDMNIILISFNDNYEISFDVKILCSRKLITKYRSIIIIRYIVRVGETRAHYIIEPWSVRWYFWCIAQVVEVRPNEYDSVSSAVVAATVDCNKIYQESIAGNTTYTYDMLVIYFWHREK